MIRGVAVGNQVVPLVSGNPVPKTTGETLKVFYAFNYKVAETVSVEIWASLYTYTAGILDRLPLAQTKQTIVLEKALTFQPYEGEIDITIGDISSGTYGLICEVPAYDVEDHIDECIEVIAPPSMMEMMGPILVIGLMAAMVGMMPKEY